MTSGIEKRPSLEMDSRIAQHPSPSTSMAPQSIKSYQPSSSIFTLRKRTRHGSGGISTPADIDTFAEGPASYGELFCAVCLRDLNRDGIELECRHKFHSHCLEPVSYLTTVLTTDAKMSVMRKKRWTKKIRVSN